MDDAWTLTGHVSRFATMIIGGGGGGGIAARGGKFHACVSALPASQGVPASFSRVNLTLVGPRDPALHSLCCPMLIGTRYAWRFRVTRDTDTRTLARAYPNFPTYTRRVRLSHSGLIVGYACLSNMRFCGVSRARSRVYRRIIAKTRPCSRVFRDTRRGVRKFQRSRYLRIRLSRSLLGFSSGSLIPRDTHVVFAGYVMCTLSRIVRSFLPRLHAGHHG